MATSFVSTNRREDIEISVDVVESLHEGWVVKQNGSALPDSILSYNDAWVSTRYPDESFLFLPSGNWMRKVQIFIDLGDYIRAFDDAARGAVNNTPTLNIHGGLVAGGWTDENSMFFDLSPEQVEKCEHFAGQYGASKIIVYRKKKGLVAQIGYDGEKITL